MHPHERLDVWKKGIELAEEVYAITGKFPKHEVYGLTSQLRRAGVSVSANIAEGAARHTKMEFRQFLYIARGSLCELETEICIASRLGYLTDTEFQAIRLKSRAVGAMLTGLIKSMDRG